MNWNTAKTIIHSNPEVQYELQMNETEYKIIEAIITARKEKQLTQKQLAYLIGSKPSEITKLENGNYHPSISFLSRVANAVGKKLQVNIV